VIRGHYAEGKTFREIAEAEGVSRQAVSQWRGQALKTLRGRVTEALAN
jgi:DNA-directed RNA polymerase specialized sigma subunit